MGMVERADRSGKKRRSCFLEGGLLLLLLLLGTLVALGVLYSRGE